MRRFWTPAELRLARSMYPHCHTVDVAAWLGRSAPAVYNLAFNLRLRKSRAYMAADAQVRGERSYADPRMHVGRFQPGLTPWNKGLRGWDAGGRSHRTRFRKGHTPQTWLPVGSTAVDDDGYVRLKVADTGRRPTDWQMVHRAVWEAAHGPVPAGKVIVFKPGRKTTDIARITEDALECIDRAELARRNHPRTRDPELGRLIQLKGAINRQVNRIAREAKEHA